MAKKGAARLQYQKTKSEPREQIKPNVRLVAESAEADKRGVSYGKYKAMQYVGRI